MLKSLLRKLSGLKQKVQKGSNYDKLNLSDDVREQSPLVKSVVNRTARNMYQKILRTDLTSLPEDFDVNQPSSLSVQEFVMTSVAKNPSANLLLLEIIAGEEESIEVDGDKISITTDDGVSDHDSIKALIDANSQASALITVTINSDQGAELVDAEDLTSFSGAIG